MARKKGRLKMRFLQLVVLVLCPTFVLTLSIISDPRIASKVEFTTDCVDDLGNIKAHEDTWTTAGACDRNRCYHHVTDHILGTLRKFKIIYSCADILDSQNPDNPNCQPVADTTAAFPACCPVLQCATASPLTTLSPTACYDRSSSFACSFWYNMTGGCQPGMDQYNDRLYNYTLIGCRKSCGHC